VSHGRQVYPLRFGQPFVDAIYDAILHSVRGISSAVIHVHKDKSFQDIEVFFKITHMLSGSDEVTTYAERRVLDEKFPPKVLSYWVTESGTIVAQKTPLCQYLGTNMFSRTKIKIEPEHWEQLEIEGYTPVHWSQLVNRAVGSVQSHLNEQQQLDGYKTQLLSIYAFIMVLAG
jgi:ATP-dependent helicase HepA